MRVISCVPAGQVVQTVALDAEILPALQPKQYPDPAKSANLPAAQGRHCVDAVCADAVAEASERNLPASQAVQLELAPATAPTTSLYLPDRHVTHDV